MHDMSTSYHPPCHVCVANPASRGDGGGGDCGEEAGDDDGVGHVDDRDDSDGVDVDDGGGTKDYADDAAESPVCLSVWLYCRVWPFPQGRSTRWSLRGTIRSRSWGWQASHWASAADVPCCADLLCLAVLCCDVMCCPVLWCTLRV